MHSSVSDEFLFKTTGYLLFPHMQMTNPSVVQGLFAKIKSLGGEVYILVMSVGDPETI